MCEIAVVVPTIRDITPWLNAWREQLHRHHAWLLIVYDGEEPRLEVQRFTTGSTSSNSSFITAIDLLGKDADLISHRTPACRNLGLAAVALREDLRHVDVIVTLDDDTRPNQATLRSHCLVLDQRVPISWLPTATDPYMRGFPYGVREEAPVMFSHGVWRRVPDLDAPTQLTLATSLYPQFYSGPIPRGIYAPICGMNCAFRREVLPYTYWAPAVDLPGAERFGDIWMGLSLVNDFRQLDWAIYTGGAEVICERASDPIKNLAQEYRGIEINETLWREGNLVPEGPYREFFQTYKEKRDRWKALIQNALSS